MEMNKLHDGYVEFLSSRSGPHMVSLAFNKTVTLEFARERVTSLHKSIDRVIFGQDFYTYPAERRSAFTFVFEHLNTNVHCHGFWDVRAHNVTKFETRCCTPVEHHGARLSRPLLGETKEVPQFELVDWRELVPSGTSRVVPVWDAVGAAKYMAKEISADWNADGLFLSEDLFSTLAR